jgi:hypothetical protein
MTREAALTELEKPPFDPVRVAQEKEYIAKKFELTVAELEEILASPPRSSRDYPNDKRKLELVYRIYRRWFSA